MDEYSDWLLNSSIASHFDAFKDGFDLVMGHNCLADLFLPEELEMMVCGSNVSGARQDDIITQFNTVLGMAYHNTQ